MLSDQMLVQTEHSSQVFIFISNITCIVQFGGVTLLVSEIIPELATPRQSLRHNI